MTVGHASERVFVTKIHNTGGTRAVRVRLNGCGCSAVGLDVSPFWVLVRRDGTRQPIGGVFGRTEALKAAAYDALRLGEPVELGRDWPVGDGAIRERVARLEPVELSDAESERTVDRIQLAAVTDLEGLYDGQVKRLLGMLFKVTDRASAESFTASMGLARSMLAEGRETQAWAKAFSKRFSERLARPRAAIANKVVPHIRDVSGGTIKSTKAELKRLYGLPISQSFTQADDAAIAAFSEMAPVHHDAWLRGQTAATQARVGRILERGIATGRSPDEMARQIQGISRNVARVEGGYWTVYANAVVGRARTMGQLTGFQSVGITKMVVSAVLDEVTTDICRFMDGKVIDVQAGLDYMEAGNKAMLDGDGDALKEENPWLRERTIDGKPWIVTDRGPGGLSKVAEVSKPGFGVADRIGTYKPAIDTGPKGLADAGIGPPPYHALCRSTVVPDTSTITLPAGGAGAGTPIRFPTPPRPRKPRPRRTPGGRPQSPHKFDGNVTQKKLSDHIALERARIEEEIARAERAAERAGEEFSYRKRFAALQGYVEKQTRGNGIGFSNKRVGHLPANAEPVERLYAERKTRKLTGAERKRWTSAWNDFKRFVGAPFKSRTAKSPPVWRVSRSGRGFHRPAFRKKPDLGSTVACGSRDHYAKFGTTERPTVFHEHGHWLEDVSGKKTRKASHTFAKMRRRPGEKVRKLRDIYPGSNYAADEIAIEDSWINAYTGRIYGKEWGREVISMGVEQFADVNKMGWFFLDDPDHFSYVVSVLRGDFL